VLLLHALELPLSRYCGSSRTVLHQRSFDLSADASRSWGSTKPTICGRPSDRLK